MKKQHIQKNNDNDDSKNKFIHHLSLIVKNYVNSSYRIPISNWAVSVNGKEILGMNYV